MKEFGKITLAKTGRILNQFFKKNIWVQLLVIVVFAAVVRCVYWVIAPEAHAGDTHTYLTIAQAIRDGKIAVALEFPFHIVYSLLLVPGFIIPNGLIWYIPLLHIGLSSIAVVLLFLISREITQDSRAHLLTAVVGVFYPSLLHWMKYILTEVAFVTILLAFVYLTIRILRKPNNTLWIIWVCFAIIVLFTRPVSLLVLVVSGIAVVAGGLRRYFPERWSLITGALVFLGIIIGIVILSIPAVNQRVATLHSVTESLWLSTRVVSGTFDEYTKAELPPETSGMTASELREYKKNISITFIRTQPGKYILMAVERFFNYFYPWIHPQWTFRHRLFDAALSIVLTITAFASLKAPVNKNLILFLVTCVFALGVTTAFSQIDTDGRYRLPAEVLIVPVSCAGFVDMVRKSKKALA